MRQLTFNETVRLAVNSLAAGVIDNAAAVKMIEDVAHGRCCECNKNYIESEVEQNACKEAG